MKNRKLFSFALLGALCFSSLVGAFTYEKNAAKTEADSTRYPNHDADTYYNDIDDTLTGTALLSQLQSLNAKRRKSTVGYKAMLNDPENGFYVTDPGIGSSTITTFYSGKNNQGTGGLNREHVWPKSKGGNLVENDIHMPKPTLNSENGNRGNSFYVEGKCSQSSGWDPAATDFGKEDYRGDSARDVFYCCVANSTLTLVDKETDNDTNKTMGKLSDLIKWHLNYPILEREEVRNEGAESLQGNRNPFVDHPEYVCKIWGNTNDATRKLCANDPYDVLVPTNITLSDTSVTLVQGQTKKVSVASTVPSNASKQVFWTIQNESVATIAADGTITSKGVGNTVITATSKHDSTVKATIALSVVEPELLDLTKITVFADKSSIFTGKTAQLSVSVQPENCYPYPSITFASSDSNIAMVSSTGLVTGISEGDVTITATATQKSIVKSASVDITVKKQEGPEYELLTPSVSLSENDEVVLALGIESDSLGVSGHSTNDATVSSNKVDWIHYVAKDVSGNNFKLYDPSEEQYIASVTKNTFAYDSTGGTFTKDETGRVYCSSAKRYLCKNNTYYRFYQSTSTYPIFLAYKSNGGDEPTPVVVDIEVTPSKIDYKVNDQFVKPVVNAVYSNGSKYDVSNQATSTGYNMSQTGTQTVTTSYNGFSKTYTINITQEQPPVLTSVYVAKMPNKTTYDVNDTLDTTGLVIKARYDKGDDIDVTNLCTFTPTVFTSAGKTTVLATYTVGFVCSFDVTVVGDTPIGEKVPTLITPINPKTNYKVGDTFELPKITVTYNDGSTSEKDNATASGYDMSKAGNQLVNLSYTENGKTLNTSYAIYVEDVFIPITSISLSVDKVDLDSGSSCIISALIVPTNATIVEIFWETDHQDIVGIEHIDKKTIKVTGKNVGQAKITISDCDYSVVASCTVNVRTHLVGCGGNVITTSVILSTISLLGVGLLLIKKKREY